jgi:hypothetical protein
MPFSLTSVPILRLAIFLFLNTESPTPSIKSSPNPFCLCRDNPAVFYTLQKWSSVVDAVAKSMILSDEDKRKDDVAAVSLPLQSRRICRIGDFASRFVAREEIESVPALVRK